MSEPTTDLKLIAAYASGDAGAFGELVRRHIGLVYSAALRQTGRPEIAEDVTQAVFLLLSRRARHFSSGVVLSAWLYRTARFAAKDAIKQHRRRQFHESRAAMRAEAKTENAEEDSAWPQISGKLDDAMQSLRQRDRTAILLRYFEGRSIREVGHALGSTEAAAGQRLTRALERLRRYFANSGANLSVAALGTALARNAILAPPTRLANSISPAAASAHPSIVSIAKGATRMMFWSKAKIVAAFLLCVSALALPAIVRATAPQSPRRVLGAPPAATTQPYQTALPGGGSLEILLSDPDANPRQFWTADGTPFDATALPFQMDVQKETLKPDRRRIVVLLRPRDAQGERVDFGFSALNSEGFGGGVSLQKDGKWYRDWVPMMVTLKAEQADLGIELGLPLGQWRMIADWGTYGQAANEHFSDRRFIVEPGMPAARDGDIIVPLALQFPQMFDWSERLIAVLADGKRQPASTGLGMRVMSGVGVTSFRFNRDLSLKPDDVKSYELEVLGNTKVKIQRLPTLSGLRAHPDIQITPPPQLPAAK